MSIVFGLVLGEITPEDMAELSCYIVTDEMKAFDLRPLQKTDGSVYESDGLKWNFCAYLPETRTFAALDDGTPLTSSKLTKDEASLIK